MNNSKSAKRDTSILTWADVRVEVSKVNQELGDLIDSISPGKDFKFVKASYIYGDTYVQYGETQLPINNDLIPISHSSIPKNIQNELCYSSFPLALLLEKSSEFFVNAGKRITPVNLFHKGELTGTYEAMDYMTKRESHSIWNLCAGSCSMLMLPKITDKSGIKKLRTIYDIPPTTKIEKLSDHWELFKNIARNDNFADQWHNTILFFGKKWLDKHDSKEWDKFRDYLQRIIWEQANYAIDKLRFNMFWESCARILSLHRLQPKPYLIDHVKHLLSIVAGNFPAFTVANNPQEFAPITCLQKVFTEQYELKQYLPTFMHACMLKDKVIKPRYVYYSLAIPTILEGSPIKKTSSTIINDLREIKLLIETLKKDAHKINLNIATEKIIQNIDIDYFHYENDECKQIRASAEAPIEDPSLIEDKKIFPNRSFCHTSPFFSGCIRLGNKERLIQQ